MTYCAQSGLFVSVDLTDTALKVHDHPGVGPSIKRLSRRAIRVMIYGNSMKGLTQESTFETRLATFCKQAPARTTVFDWSTISKQEEPAFKTRRELVFLSLLLQLKTLKL